jgi:hypothetical protein
MLPAKNYKLKVPILFKEAENTKFSIQIQEPYVAPTSSS